MQAALAERAAAMLSPPSRTEILDGCGHFLQLERPDEVNALIAEFVRG
jgi:pimeloyl-ACP methyl ester carboxylesterase